MMGRETKVTCDMCGEDLTTTGNCEDWRLVLTYEAKTPWFVAKGKRGGAVTSMAISPPVDRTYIFCALGCLAAWLSDEHPNAHKDFERLMQHREWLEEQRTIQTLDNQGDGE